MGISPFAAQQMIERCNRNRKKHERNDNPERVSPDAEPERALFHEPLAAPSGEAQNSDRFAVCIRVFRRRLLDPDNICPKYFIDGLRYAGLIPDDRPQDIELSVTQEKCVKGSLERTQIIIKAI